jgi:hypothetical protein
MNHRVSGWVFAFGIGILVAVLSYRWITNPAPRVERQMQETAVLAARQHLPGATGIIEPEIVDPLAPDRKVGKVYIYREGDNWEVSGYYRRGENDEWHPFLMTLDETNAITYFKVQDAALVERAAADQKLEVLP